MRRSGHVGVVRLPVDDPTTVVGADFHQAVAGRQSLGEDVRFSDAGAVHIYVRRSGHIERLLQQRRRIDVRQFGRT